MEEVGGEMRVDMIIFNCIHVQASQRDNKKETSQEMNNINIHTVVG